MPWQGILEVAIQQNKTGPGNVCLGAHSGARTGMGVQYWASLNEPIPLHNARNNEWEKTMLLYDLRCEIIEYGKKTISSGLTKGTGGNMSAVCREKNLMAITPSGIDYFKITPEQIMVLDVETGKVVDGTAIPSSERDMHRIFYKYRTDIDAMIHTHTTFAATIACMNWDLPAVHYLLANAGTDVRCAPYATYGSLALAKAAYEYMAGRKAVLLANHGMLAGGKTLGEAFGVTEAVEFCCELYYRTKSMGEPVILPQAEMEMMIERFKDYGRSEEIHENI